MLPLVQGAGSEWDDLLSRVARSNGKIHLHVLRAPEGDLYGEPDTESMMRYSVLPLRLRSSIYNTERHRLAQMSSGADRDKALEEVVSILEQDWQSDGGLCH